MTSCLCKALKLQMAQSRFYLHALGMHILGALGKEVILPARNASTPQKRSKAAPETAHLYAVSEAEASQGAQYRLIEEHTLNDNDKAP